MMIGETPRDLTVEDAMAIERSPLVSQVAPAIIGSGTASWRQREREITVLGTTSKMRTVQHWSMRAGQFLPELDMDVASPVCVLGSVVRDEFFGSADPLGQWIRIGDARCRVIGVLAQAGLTGPFNTDELVIVPVASAQQIFNATSLLRIIVEVIGNDAIEGARRDVIEIVKARHQGEEDITVVSRDAVLDTFNTIFDAITYALAGIAAISLVVAGVLIMKRDARGGQSAHGGDRAAEGARRQAAPDHRAVPHGGGFPVHAGRFGGPGFWNLRCQSVERGLSGRRVFRAAVGPGRRRRDCGVERPGLRDSACTPGRAAGSRGSAGRALTDACPRHALRFTLRSVLAHRLRSALTSLGIGIGVTAVVLLTSIGQGVSQYIVEEFTQFGTNILAIQPGKANTLGVSAGVFNSVRPLSLADAEALRRVPYATHSVPLVSGQASVEARGRERSVMVFAVGPAFDIAFAFDVALGEFLPDDELDRARPVAVLGATALRGIVRLGKPVERPRAHRRRPLPRHRRHGSQGRYAGIRPRRHGLYPGRQRAWPCSTATACRRSTCSTKRTRPVEEVIAGVERVLIARHGGEDFTILSQQQMLDVLGSILNVLTLGVAALGGISLLVGGVGIFTIMTISVRERTAEIGPPASRGRPPAPDIPAVSRRSGPAGGPGRSRGIAGRLHRGRDRSSHRARFPRSNRPTVRDPRRSGRRADRPRRRRVAGSGRRRTGAGRSPHHGVTGPETENVSGGRFGRDTRTVEKHYRITDPDQAARATGQ